MRSTHTISRRALLGVAGVVAFGLVASCGSVRGTSDPASGDSEYPTKSIEFIVPVAPGGSTDTLARALAKGLAKELGKPVVVVNKPGAGATVGLTEAKNAQADGYSIALIPTSTLTVRPLVVRDPDPLTVDDFTVVRSLATEDVVLYTFKGSRFKTAQDVVALKNGGSDVKFSTSGAGTVTGTAQSIFFELLGAKATAVPFDGGAPAKTAVLGKQVELGGGHPGEIAAEVKEGTLIPLVVFGSTPSPWFPAVPTAQSLGYKMDFDQRRLFGAPRGLPDEVRSKLAEAATKAQASDEYKKTLEQGHFVAWETDGPEAAQTIKDKGNEYRQQVKDLGINLSN